MGFLIAAIIIAAILCLPLSVRVISDGEFSLIAGIGFIRLRIFPLKEKTLKLSDYEIGKFRKKRQKQADKAKKASKDSKKAEKPKAQPTNDKKIEEKRDIPALIKKLTRVTAVFIKRFGKHLRIELKKVILIIASEDAATTALIYGAAIGAAQDLYALLVSSGTLRTTNKSEFIVEPDFLSEKPHIEIDLKFSFREWQLFDMAIRALIEFLKNDEDE